MTREIFEPRKIKELVGVAESLTKFLHRKRVKNLILIDRSARPAHLAISRVWRKEFPRAPRPEIYFINPEGFDNWERSQLEVEEDFKHNHRRLHERSGERTAIFDTCYHTGLTVAPIIRTLDSLGFEKLYITSYQKVRLRDKPSCKVKIDFSAVDHAYGVCYPFGRDCMVTKSGNKVVSQRAKDSMDIEHSREIRREISKGLAKHGY